MFVVVHSNADPQTLLSYHYEFRGIEVFSHHIRYLTIRLSDPEIGGVHVVPFN